MEYEIGTAILAFGCFFLALKATFAVCTYIDKHGMKSAALGNAVLCVTFFGTMALSAYVASYIFH